MSKIENYGRVIKSRGFFLQAIILLLFVNSYVLSSNDDCQGRGVKSPWSYDRSEYCPGKFGTGLRCDWSRAKIYLRAPGYFPTKTGTVQMWVSPVQDLSSLDDYAIYMDVPSRLTVAMLPPNDTRSHKIRSLFCGFKTMSKLSGVYEPLNWKRGEWHALAVTWDKSGFVFYLDGRAIVKKRKTPTGIDKINDLVVFGGNTFLTEFSARSIIDEIEISDCIRSPEYIRAYAKGIQPPVLDEHTMALNHCEKRSPEAYFKMTKAYRKRNRPFVVGDSSALTNNQIFDSPEEVRMPFILVNPSDKPVEFKIIVSVKDFYKESQKENSIVVTVEPGKVLTKSLAPNVSKYGWFSVKAKALANGKQVFSAERSFVVSKPFPKKLLNANNFFGNHLGKFKRRDLFSRIGIGWDRDYSFSSFTWRKVEPEKSCFDWREADFAVKSAKENGYQLLPVLGHPPVWAGKVPDNMGAWVKKYKIYRSYSYEPRDLKEFENYIFEVVSRYKNDIKYWEIWNEPDWNRPSGVGVGFTGSDQAYLNVLKTACRVAKKANPDCVIVSGGMTPHPHLIKYLASHGGEKYFNILGMHRYRSWHAFMQSVKEIERVSNPRKPVWQTEKQLFDPLPAVVEVQTAFLNGIDKYFWFSYRECFYENNWLPKPMYYAMAVCCEHLADAKLSRQIDLKKHKGILSALIFNEGKDNQIVTICFNYKGPNRLSVELAVPKGKEIIVTHFMGKKQTLKGKDQQTLSIAVDGFIYISGKFNPNSLKTKAIEGKSFVLNHSFEDIDGDISLEGLKKMRFNNWTFRNKNGGIFPSKNSSKGKYALEIIGKGKGKVYAFQYITLAEPGKYKMTVDLKKKNKDNNLSAYLMVWDKHLGKVCAEKIFAQVGDKSYAPYSMTFSIKKPDKNDNSQKAIIVGIKNGKGILFADNVKIEKIVLDWNSLNAVPIDLSAYTNQTFDDEVKGDGTGGWADMGKGNLKFFKTGQRVISGIPFDIIDNDETGKKKSCLILGSSIRPSLPLKIDGIKINKKLKAIYFLQTAMYVKAKKGKKLGKYVIHFDDETSATKKLVRCKNIDDWYLPVISPKVKIAEKVYSPAQMEHALFVDEWKNPYPNKKIKSIDFISEGKGILVLIAISGAK